MVLMRIRRDRLTGAAYVSAEDLLKWAKGCAKNKRSGVFMRNSIRTALREGQIK